MKKFIAIVVSAILVLSLGACGAQEKTPAESGQAQIPNPFVSCENLAQAADIAGFEMTPPARIPNWMTDTEIRAVKDNMIEIVYTGTPEQELRIRKAPGQDDISGMYGTFEQVEEIQVDDLTVTVKGGGDKFHVATWTDGDYAFSVVSDDGLELEPLKDMISSIQ